MAHQARLEAGHPFVLDRNAARAVDQAATAEFGLPGIVLMENAAIALAREAVDLAEGEEIAVVCGGGNNGGDGWALARHLANAGRHPVVIEFDPPRDGTDAAINRAVAVNMGVEVGGTDRLDDGAWSLVVDAIFGTGLDRPITGVVAEVIERLGTLSAPILAVDIPSGLDADTGAALGCAVRATRTMTFVGVKPGFLEPAAAAYLGEVVIAGIGAPRALTERFGYPLPADSDARSILRSPA